MEEAYFGPRGMRLRCHISQRLLAATFPSAIGVGQGKSCVPFQVHSVLMKPPGFNLETPDDLS